MTAMTRIMIIMNTRTVRTVVALLPTRLPAYLPTCLPAVEKERRNQIFGIDSGQWSVDSGHAHLLSVMSTLYTPPI
jgi:hypothetical protein